ncbi:unnamed protein product [Angiostrongylus costaricensis]|uniref:DUF4283 domain-containing protein n=1 Tax=Angiostrongylus costaricensis TaxID=334426 RepID=A0A158PGM5_ANGCS|nr:unnamed protein product [Angiostrongylus costaricensis]
MKILKQQLKPHVKVGGSPWIMDTRKGIECEMHWDPHDLVMFRKPSDDDCYQSRIVKAKPLPTKYAQKLSMSGKDFVSSGCEGGSNTSNRASCSSPSTVPLTEDERNKIHAKILKAEMKGDLEAVEKLRRKLEGKVEKNESVVLLKRDRSGNVIPAQGSKGSSKCFAESSSRIHREYGKQQSVEEMMREEKSSTAEDQLMLFHRSIILIMDLHKGTFGLYSFGYAVV